ncbi:LysR family transcriptional regulator [Actinomadura rupiterrae]|uniref:LysR family transcriptional regulator n=1 Tax=Actinomadura rupiterrae TaxID=559627 RepID=UPI0020A5E4E1|nr:LysR substrate-binding domain-containing protein [Actinomadura rupiterrae]MCP2339322.1 DNA-binding transcriptional LysR family regulator [Actinomadura rupiterrae]
MIGATMKMLALDAVQAFVLTAELKSFTRAAEAMDSTQSAVSLKIKRLEDVLGRRLLDRSPRLVRLSPDGAAFLGPARELLAAHADALGSFGVQRQRLSIGISDHVIGAELPYLLRRLGQAEPDLTLQVSVGSSWELLDQFDGDALDAVIVLRHEGRRTDGEVLFEESFGWMASSDFQHRSGEPLRLALQAESCHVHQMAATALDEAGIAWQAVFVGGGIATIGAAAAAGLAVAALSPRVAPPGTIDMGETLGLPRLPTRSVVLQSRPSEPAVRRALRTFASALRATAGH